MTTKTLLKELTGDEEGPWLSFNKAGNPITDRQLARSLKDYRHGLGIKSTTVRVEGLAPAKGYYRADFEEDFARYSVTTKHFQ